MSNEEGTSSVPMSISHDLYNDLVYYFKYASSAYTALCLRPNGNHLVIEVSNPLTDIQGFIARDDHRKEIVVALRGSASVADIVMDVQVALVPFISPGVKFSSEIRVHSGFLFSWDSVAVQIITMVGKELVHYPNYSVVTTGHSLGGSLAILGAITLQQNFETPIRTYSYGAPRTGNKKICRLRECNIW